MRDRRVQKLSVLLLAATVGLSTGCAGGSRSDEVTVFAAASLRQSLTDLGTQFEADNPGVRVIFSFAGSSTLARQVDAGAPADVVALAGDEPMRQLVAAGAVAAPSVFARNQLVIAVAEGNPRQITSLRSLADPQVTVAVCAAPVPCGSAADTVLALAGVSIVPVTREPDVTAALARVRQGEVDAALVYRTDVAPDDAEVEAIEFPESDESLVGYHIAVVREGGNTELGQRFAELVRSSTGQTVLAQLGFAAP